MPHTLQNEAEASPSVKNLSLPRIMLHVEGAAVLLLSIALYAHLRGSAVLFLALILVPDVAMVGYLVNKQVGAVIYNVGHNYGLPLALGLAALMAGWQLGVLLAIIWVAHIGMDRAAGYGMKYSSGFKDTHFNRI